MCAALAAAVSAPLLTATAAHADRDVAVSMGLEGMGGLQIQMSQGQPTNCTRDEQYGIAVINPDQAKLQFRMVAKNGGSCAVDDSVNTWHLEMPGGSGNVIVKGWSGVYPYHANCGGGWTGPYECVWGYQESTIRRRADGLPASAHPCTIVGTAGDDTLRGTSGDDVICGRGGDDVIDGRGGDDIIRGGPGRDRLAGGAGDDSISGGPGRDVVVKDGHDSVVQGAGDEDVAKQLVGDHRETGTLWFHDMEGQAVTTSQGQPSNCTKEEQYDTFTPQDANDFHTYGATIKSDGWCGVQPSHNVWNLTMPGGTGRVEMNDKGWNAPYQMRCLKDGWKNYTCTETSLGSMRYRVDVKPA
jgi:hypothetical protein